MDVVYEQFNSLALLRADVFALPASLFHQLVIELDEKQRLILRSREEIIITNKVEDIRSPQAQEVRECLSWLAVHDIPDRKLSNGAISSGKGV